MFSEGDFKPRFVLFVVRSCCFLEYMKLIELEVQGEKESRLNG